LSFPPSNHSPLPPVVHETFTTQRGNDQSSFFPCSLSLASGPAEGANFSGLSCLTDGDGSSTLPGAPGLSEPNVLVAVFYIVYERPFRVDCIPDPLSFNLRKLSQLPFEIVPSGLPFLKRMLVHLCPPSFSGFILGTGVFRVLSCFSPPVLSLADSSIH